MSHLGILALVAPTLLAQAGDPLPSWNDGAAKKSVVAFVEKVTRPDSPDFVPVPERIAVFDNDGTLWSEQPLYFQALFAFDRVRAIAPEHPEWKEREPFASVLRGDTQAALAGGEKALLELVMATHAGLSTEEFARIVREWLASAKHPTTGKPFPAMVYQPMLELLAYLRANGFKPFIVSGGGIEFMRVFAERVYGVPPEQVVGSSIVTKYEGGSAPRLVRQPELEFVDDKEGKPVGIHKHIGRRPVMAFGNSDGDFQMLQYTTIARGPDDTTPRFGLLVHHDDGEREWAYDRESHVGQLARGLDEAPRRGWTVVSMKSDWKTIYPAR